MIILRCIYNIYIYIASSRIRLYSELLDIRIWIPVIPAIPQKFVRILSCRSCPPLLVYVYMPLGWLPPGFPPALHKGNGKQCTGGALEAAVFRVRMTFQDPWLGFRLFILIQIYFTSRATGRLHCDIYFSERNRRNQILGLYLYNLTVVSGCMNNIRSRNVIIFDTDNVDLYYLNILNETHCQLVKDSAFLWNPKWFEN